MTHELFGQRFGKLVVIGIGNPYVSPKGKRASRLRCACECGKQTDVSKHDLRRGFVKSCGCVQGRQGVEHGHSRRGKQTPEYVVWASMLTRCRNANTHAWHRYGGRGITVCERWLSFENFYADMGQRPPGATLDRIDNDGPYSPDNCRWVSRKQQAQNTARVRMLEYDGKCMTLTAWAKHLGISQATLSGRLKRGWPLERALTR
jgi:hypothetical protein